MADTRLPQELIHTLLEDPAFSLCLDHCLGEPELITNFCRLCEIDLPRQPRNGIEAMVDEATGYPKYTYDKFFTVFIPFVHRAVYQPLKSQFEAGQVKS